MRKLVLAAVMSLAVASTARANIIENFGTDPTSATGAFNHSLGTLIGTFDDQYTFHLDQQMTLTIASVTNVFPGGILSSDFISNFTAAVVAGTPATPGGDVIGPVLATLGCGPITNCQGMAGSAILGPGDYFLDISGKANGSSGYGGNLATLAVPVPAVGAGLPGVVASLIGFGAWLKRRRRGAPGGTAVAAAA